MKRITKLVTFIMLVTMPQLMAKANPIEQVIKNYEVLLNSGDTDSIMKLYGENPIFMPQYLPAQVGRKAVYDAYRNVFNNIDLDIKFSIYEIEIDGNTAWARTSSSGFVKILANNKSINEGNNELFIFKKEDNKWKIHRYIFSTNMPREN